jgi:hypothetical protein
MAERKKARRSDNQSSVPSERELIMIASPEADLRATRDGVASMAAADVGTLNSLLGEHGAVARPLFGWSEDRLRQEASAMAATGAVEVPDLSVIYRVEAPDEDLDALAEQLQELDTVEAAYVKPPAEPAVEDINAMVAAPEDAPPISPDFSTRQGYLDAAPGGVNARWAWTRPGGRGANIRTTDIEGAWRFTHEDLTTNQGGVVGGTQSTDLGWRNHGTAVIGEIGADVNTFGVTGIAPDAIQTAISIFGGTGSAGAIRAAANRLRPGDIILIELHRPGPRHSFASRDDQLGYIAIEWWEDDFAAIRYAVGRGVIVVEAAGNGAENLDDALYNTRPSGFPSSWTNPFNRSNRDSGAVVVGAGAPPPGTHGRDHGPDRSRLGFSNHGALVDAQGWGREVTTTGYGNLQGGTNEDVWYTDTFSGTSSASPIVVGALAAVQGMLQAAGRPLLTPASARRCLRSTGSPQQDAPGRPLTQRIGNRPDIPALYRCAGGIKVLKETVKEVKEVKEVRKELKEHTKDLKDARKELKELQKELKDGRKEIKEIKEVKEVKEFERKEPDVKRLEVGPGGAAGYGPSLDERVANLEAVVDELSHFIAPELRPDLSQGALGYEADVGAADEAKALKDQKDMEKLGEA